MDFSPRAVLACSSATSTLSETTLDFIEADVVAQTEILYDETLVQITFVLVAQFHCDRKLRWCWQANSPASIVTTTYRHCLLLPYVRRTAGNIRLSRMSCGSKAMNSSCHSGRRQ